jgi:hypothetical protein
MRIQMKKAVRLTIPRSTRLPLFKSNLSGAETSPGQMQFGNAPVMPDLITDHSYNRDLS